VSVPLPPGAPPEAAEMIQKTMGASAGMPTKSGPATPTNK
jgi:hypothetical protein